MARNFSGFASTQGGGGGSGGGGVTEISTEPASAATVDRVVVNPDEHTISLTEAEQVPAVQQDADWTTVSSGSRLFGSTYRGVHASDPPFVNADFTTVNVGDVLWGRDYRGNANSNPGVDAGPTGRFTSLNAGGTIWGQPFSGVHASDPDIVVGDPNFGRLTKGSQFPFDGTTGVNTVVRYYWLGAFTDSTIPTVPTDTTKTYAYYNITQDTWFGAQGGENAWGSRLLSRIGWSTSGTGHVFRGHYPNENAAKGISDPAIDNWVVIEGDIYRIDGFRARRTRWRHQPLNQRLTFGGYTWRGVHATTPGAANPGSGTHLYYRTQGTPSRPAGFYHNQVGIWSGITASNAGFESGGRDWRGVVSDIDAAEALDNLDNGDWAIFSSSLWERTEEDATAQGSRYFRSSNTSWYFLTGDEVWRATTDPTATFNIPVDEPWLGAVANNAAALRASGARNGAVVYYNGQIWTLSEFQPTNPNYRFQTLAVESGNTLPFPNPDGLSYEWLGVLSSNPRADQIFEDSVYYNTSGSGEFRTIRPSTGSRTWESRVPLDLGFDGTNARFRGVVANEAAAQRFANPRLGIDWFIYGGELRRLLEPIFWYSTGRTWRLYTLGGWTDEPGALFDTDENPWIGTFSGESDAESSPNLRNGGVVEYGLQVRIASNYERRYGWYFNSAESEWRQHAASAFRTWTVVADPSLGQDAWIGAFANEAAADAADGLANDAIAYFSNRVRRASAFQPYEPPYTRYEYQDVGGETFISTEPASADTYGHVIVNPNTNTASLTNRTFVPAVEQDADWTRISAGDPLFGSEFQGVRDTDPGVATGTFTEIAADSELWGRDYRGTFATDPSLNVPQSVTWRAFRDFANLWDRRFYGEHTTDPAGPNSRVVGYVWTTVSVGTSIFSGRGTGGFRGDWQGTRSTDPPASGVAFDIYYNDGSGSLPAGFRRRNSSGDAWNDYDLNGETQHFIGVYDDQAAAEADSGRFTATRRFAYWGGQLRTVEGLPDLDWHPWPTGTPLPFNGAIGSAYVWQGAHASDPAVPPSGAHVYWDSTNEEFKRVSHPAVATWTSIGTDLAILGFGSNIHADQRFRGLVDNALAANALGAHSWDHDWVIYGNELRRLQGPIYWRILGNWRVYRGLTWQAINGDDLDNDGGPWIGQFVRQEAAERAPGFRRFAVAVWGDQVQSVRAITPASTDFTWRVLADDQPLPFSGQGGVTYTWRGVFADEAAANAAVSNTNSNECYFDLALDAFQRRRSVDNSWTSLSAAIGLLGFGTATARFQGAFTDENEASRQSGLEVTRDWAVFGNELRQLLQPIYYRTSDNQWRRYITSWGDSDGATLDTSSEPWGGAHADEAAALASGLLADNAVVEYGDTVYRVSDYESFLGWYYNWTTAEWRRHQASALGTWEVVADPSQGSDVWIGPFHVEASADADPDLANGAIAYFANNVYRASNFQPAVPATYTYAYEAIVPGTPDSAGTFTNALRNKLNALRVISLTSLVLSGSTLTLNFQRYNDSGTAEAGSIDVNLSRLAGSGGGGGSVTAADIYAALAGVPTQNLPGSDDGTLSLQLVQGDGSATGGSGIRQIGLSAFVTYLNSVITGGGGGGDVDVDDWELREAKAEYLGQFSTTVVDNNVAAGEFFLDLESSTPLLIYQRGTVTRANALFGAASGDGTAKVGGVVRFRKDLGSGNRIDIDFEITEAPRGTGSTDEWSFNNLKQYNRSVGAGNEDRTEVDVFYIPPPSIEDILTAGTNVTLTVNDDGTITIESSGGGSATVDAASLYNALTGSGVDTYNAAQLSSSGTVTMWGSEPDGSSHSSGRAGLIQFRISELANYIATLPAFSGSGGSVDVDDWELREAKAEYLGKFPITNDDQAVPAGAFFAEPTDSNIAYQRGTHARANALFGTANEAKVGGIVRFRKDLGSGNRLDVDYEITAAGFEARSAAGRWWFNGTNRFNRSVGASPAARTDVDVYYIPPPNVDDILTAGTNITLTEGADGRLTIAATAAGGSADGRVYVTESGGTAPTAPSDGFNANDVWIQYGGRVTDGSIGDIQEGRLGAINFQTRNAQNDGWVGNIQPLPRWGYSDGGIPGTGTTSHDFLIVRNTTSDGIYRRSGVNSEWTNIFPFTAAASDGRVIISDSTPTEPAAGWNANDVWLHTGTTVLAASDEAIARTTSVVSYFVRNPANDGWDTRSTHDSARWGVGAAVPDNTNEYLNFDFFVVTGATNPGLYVHEGNGSWTRILSPGSGGGGGTDTTLELGDFELRAPRETDYGTRDVGLGLIPAGQGNFAFRGSDGRLTYSQSTATASERTALDTLLLSADSIDVGGIIRLRKDLGSDNVLDVELRVVFPPTVDTTTFPGQHVTVFRNLAVTRHDQGTVPTSGTIDDVRVSYLAPPVVAGIGDGSGLSSEAVGSFMGAFNAALTAVDSSINIAGVTDEFLIVNFGDDTGATNLRPGQWQFVRTADLLALTDSSVGDLITNDANKWMRFFTPQTGGDSDGSIFYLGTRSNGNITIAPQDSSEDALPFSVRRVTGAGTSVVPNPTGTGGTALESISIDGTRYTLPTGGTGSSVSVVSAVPADADGDDGDTRIVTGVSDITNGVYHKASGSWTQVVSAPTTAGAADHEYVTVYNTESAAMPRGRMAVIGGPLRNDGTSGGRIRVVNGDDEDDGTSAVLRLAPPVGLVIGSLLPKANPSDPDEYGIPSNGEGLVLRRGVWNKAIGTLSIWARENEVYAVRNVANENYGNYYVYRNALTGPGYQLGEILSTASSGDGAHEIYWDFSSRDILYPSIEQVSTFIPTGRDELAFLDLPIDEGDTERPLSKARVKDVVRSATEFINETGERITADHIIVEAFDFQGRTDNGLDDEIPPGRAYDIAHDDISSGSRPLGINEYPVHDQTAGRLLVWGVRDRALTDFHIGTASPWAVGTTYDKGDVVLVGNNFYQADRGHLSATGNVADGSPTQAAATGWRPANTSPIPVWDDGINYGQGTIVEYSGDFYRAVDAHTSVTGDAVNGAPDQPLATQWVETLVTFVTDIPPTWGVGNNYALNAKVEFDGRYYNARRAHQSRAGSGGNASPGAANQTAWERVFTVDGIPFGLGDRVYMNWHVDERIYKFAEQTNVLPGAWCVGMVVRVPSSSRQDWDVLWDFRNPSPYVLPRRIPADPDRHDAGAPLLVREDGGQKDIWYGNPNQLLPADGTENQVPTKRSDGSVAWRSPPDGGGGLTSLLGPTWCTVTLPSATSNNPANTNYSISPEGATAGIALRSGNDIGLQIPQVLPTVIIGFRIEVLNDAEDKVVGSGFMPWGPRGTSNTVLDIPVGTGIGGGATSEVRVTWGFRGGDANSDSDIAPNDVLVVAKSGWVTSTQNPTPQSKVRIIPIVVGASGG